MKSIFIFGGLKKQKFEIVVEEDFVCGGDRRRLGFFPKELKRERFFFTGKQQRQMLTCTFDVPSMVHIKELIIIDKKKKLLSKYMYQKSCIQFRQLLRS